MNISSRKNKINYGVEILRMIMAFLVIMEHFFSPRNIIMQKNIYKFRVHVPTFLIISFYYLYDNLVNRKINKIKERLKRLLIPYLLYPIITYIVYYILFSFFHYENLRTNLYQLLIQLIVGRLLCSVLWFQFNLILITILFYIIAFILKNNYLLFLQVLGILAYLFQFSNINYEYFIKYKDYIRYSVGYFAETIPFAVTGLSIASIDIINKLKKKRFFTFLFSISFIYILIKYKIFIEPLGFGKQGILFNIEAVLFFLIFSLIPLYYLNEKILILIKNLTSFTPGIYFMHGKIYLIFKDKISLIKEQTLLGCFLIYLISYSVSFIGYNIFKKNILKHLFI